MAELLKREHDIVTLKVELFGRGQCRGLLQFLVDGQLASLPLWQGALAEFGLTDSGGPRPLLDPAQFRLPDPLVHGLRDWLQANTDGSRPLWVHLVKPYGGLRYLPWERLLVDALDVPVLMLPDFIFPPPRESLSSLDIAICASAPLACEHAHVADGLHQAITAIRQGIGEQARLHLFTDADLLGPLRDRHPPDEHLIWHPQSSAEPFVCEDHSSRLHDSGGTLRSPWLLWMRECLKPYTTDVVHFVCHGHLARDRGAMLFAQSPLERTERYLAGPVGSVELCSFLTQVGAWASAFSSPFDDNDPIGLHTLADEIAQSLPGPMMLFNPALAVHDGTGFPDLAHGYRFLHSPDPQPAPKSRALFLYCQPYLLDERRDLDAAREHSEALETQLHVLARNDSHRQAARSTIAGGERTGRGAAPAKTVSALTAATERLAEQVSLDYQQVLRDAVVPADVARSDMDVATRTIDSLREAVQAVERERIRGEIDSSVREIELLAGAAHPGDALVLPAPGVPDLPGPPRAAAGDSAPDRATRIETGLLRIETLATQLHYVDGDTADIEPRLPRTLAGRIMGALRRGIAE